MSISPLEAAEKAYRDNIEGRPMVHALEAYEAAKASERTVPSKSGGNNATPNGESIGCEESDRTAVRPNTEQPVQYGYDPGTKDGDVPALTFRKGNEITAILTGDDARVVAAFIKELAEASPERESPQPDDLPSDDVYRLTCENVRLQNDLDNLRATTMRESGELSKTREALEALHNHMETCYADEYPADIAFMVRMALKI